uniref:Uncharacterized protein n=1 Tax=Arion vulgaris TaxID=1028688 RepID=A0A0B7A5G2_9EUPU
MKILMDRADIIDVTRAAHRIDDFENIYKSAFLSRVKEMGVKNGNCQTRTLLET